MQTLLAFTLILVAISALAQSSQLYKVTNPDGTVTYTDVPKPGAVLVDTPKTAVNTMPAIKTAPPPKTSGALTPKPMNIDIVAPANEATIRNNSGNVHISATPIDNLNGEYTLLLNGEAIAQNQRPSFNLESIDRGAHKIKIELRDNSGKILALSKEQTFYLHRASALINPN